MLAKNLFIAFATVSAMNGTVSAASVNTNKEEIPETSLELLRTLVNTPSGTNDAVGLKRVRDVLIQEFDRLGFKATLHDAGVGHQVVSFEQEHAQPSIMLLGHIDTVFASPSDVDHASGLTPLMRLEDGKIFGPGVIDMKGGIVLMLDLLRSLGEEDPAILQKIRVVLNDDEESGSTHSKEILRKLAKDLRYALIFEPGLPGGEVVTAHSGVRWLDLTVTGRAAHAGLEPEKGLSACVELGHKLVALSQLTDLKRRLSVNPGVISGGTAANVVCEKAATRIDIRFAALADLKATMTRIQAIARRAFTSNKALGLTSKSEITEVAALPPMPESSTAMLFSVAKRAAATLGQNLIGRGVGYASDGNHLAREGLQVLVGLGPYGGGMHTAGEFMDTQSYDQRLKLNQKLVMQLVKKDAEKK